MSIDYRWCRHDSVTVHARGAGSAHRWQCATAEQDSGQGVVAALFAEAISQAVRIHAVACTGGGCASAECDAPAQAQVTVQVSAQLTLTGVLLCGGCLQALRCGLPLTWDVAL